MALDDARTIENPQTSSTAEALPPPAIPAVR
jgi:hypothetical protein